MTDLLINDTDPRVQYVVGTVPQNNFTVPFPFFEDGDLQVIKTVNETPTTLTLDNDYTVTGAGANQGGAVLMSTPVSACLITIKRVMPLARTSDFPGVGPFPIGALNDDLDKLVMMLQQVESLILRSIRLSDDDPFTGLVLPPPGVRANKPIVFDATGAPKVADQTFDQIAAQATSALQQVQQLAQQVNQKIDQANAILQQAQQSNLLPAATVANAGKAVVVAGDNSFALGAVPAATDLSNVTNATFASKAAAAGVGGGGGGGTGNPFFTIGLYGGSY